jgi:sporulation protein YlmC with PRC-barrel domain
MFKKYMTAGIVGSALLATAAFAQSPSTSTAPAAAPATASDSANTSFNGNWRTSKVVGLNVYNEANESLGSINDLLTDKEGNIKAVVIGVGGFLGVGERLIAVPYDKIKFSNEPVKMNTASSSSTGAGGSTSSGMTTGAATSGGAAGGAAATPPKPNPWYPDHAVLSGASKDQLKAMPEFKYST